MRQWGIKLALTAAALAAAVGAEAKDRVPNEMRDMMRELGSGGLEGKKLDAAILEASKYPVGSKENPVRENMPKGERDYLERQRCPDASAPTFSRSGSTGADVYGNILDLYQVQCPGQAPVDVYIDMYHDGPDSRPLPGFSIVS
jgi:hypothetical protein